MMNLDTAIAIVQKHNAWRRGDGDDIPEPFVIGDAVKLGIAIDTVLIAAKEHGTAMMVLGQIAAKTRKTKEQRLAKSCVMFLESLR